MFGWLWVERTGWDVEVEEAVCFLWGRSRARCSYNFCGVSFLDAVNLACVDFAKWLESVCIVEEE
jgi:hypothetical protein